MDGIFVPNISIGLPVVRAIRPTTQLPLDVHLMIVQPARYAAQFCDAGADIVTCHVEADTPENIRLAIETIHARGKRAGIVLKPNTRAEAALPFLEDVELILVMTVEPGFGGQKIHARHDGQGPHPAPLDRRAQPRLRAGSGRRHRSRHRPRGRGGRRQRAGGRQRGVRRGGYPCAHRGPARLLSAGTDQAKQKERFFMEYFPAPLENLVEQFAKLPGIGSKSAQRLAFYVLGLSDAEAAAFAAAIVNAKKEVTCCPVCQNLTAGGGPCPICASPKRDPSVVCVVADPRDVIAIERAREFNGRYHVLHGVISR